MKRYEYVPVDMDWFFSSHTIEHREIIDRYAKMGYTYKGYIPTKINGEGRIRAIDLIFEIEEDEGTK